MDVEVFKRTVGKGEMAKSCGKEGRKDGEEREG